MCMIQPNSSLQPKNHCASSCKEVLIGTSAPTDCWLFKYMLQELVFQIIPKGSKDGDPSVSLEAPRVLSV